jgi:beta-mannosidase
MLTNALRQNLGGDWTFQARDRAPVGRAWLPATVPGNVHTDLMAAGRLADPFVADHEADVGWVEACGWTYRRRFRVDAALRECRRLRLVAEGLDTWCELRLNGRRLGRTENMFVEHAWDLAGRLRDGDNELEIRFEAPSRALAALEKKHGYRPAIGDERRSHGRKAQYAFGWDWGPRLAGCGIFKPIYLEGDTGVRVQDLWVRTLKATAAEARGLLVAEIHSDRALRAPLTAHVGAWRLEKTLRLKKGLNVLRLPWKLAKPRLWWPRGYGEAALVQAGLSLGTEAVATVPVGLRTVELDTAKDGAGRRFGFKVNGVPVFAKGANWIPADSFLGRVTPARIAGLVQAAADGNDNCLRVWGGGIYESEEFYRACDRLGLLVWQDFPFACNEVPEHPDFIALVKEEAAKALRRLRRHPSLALWCGNNENQMGRHDRWYRGRETAAWGEKLYETVLPELCARLDPDRPYWPGSPYGGADPNNEAQGDRHHWLVWARFADIDEYRLDFGRFISEFGFAALPNRAALRRSVPAGERWVQSRVLQMHDKVERGGAYARIAYYLLNHLPLAGGLDRFRYLSQVNQSRALRTGVEHWRRNRPHTQGALVWQHNDCWPVTSWSLLDGDDAPKLAWYGLREAFDDVLLSAVEADARLHSDKVGRLPLRAADEDGRAEAWLCLDGREPFSGVLTVERWSMDGRQAAVARVAVRAAANRSVRLWSAGRRACGIVNSARQYLVFELKGKDGRRRRSLLFFERPRRLALPDSGLVVGARADDGTVEVAVRASHLTLAVELHAPVAGRFSDNGFDLLPGETRRLRFTPDKPGPIRGAWQALCLNQCVREARRR